MNVWEIEFELEWSYSGKGVFDTGSPEHVTVVADSYESALATGRQVAMADCFDDDNDPDVVHTITDARPISVKRGVSIDAIATMKAA